MSFCAKVKNWFSDKLDSQAPQQTFATFYPDGTGKPIEARQHYFRIWLKDMRLASTTRWFTNFYPATHSLMLMQAGDDKLEIANLVGPAEFGDDMNKANIGNSVIINKPLTPRIPFAGGTVSLDAGLVSIPAEGGLKAALDIVSSFAKSLNVPQVTTLLQFSEPVAASIGQLMQLDGTAIQLNFSGSFTASDGGGKLEDAYFVVASLPEGTLKSERLFMVNEKLRVGDTAETAQPLDDCNYVVFHIERIESRDDYASFSYIAKPTQEAIRAKLAGEDEKAKLLRTQALTSILASKDLTEADKYRIVKAVKERIDNMGGLQIAAGDLDLDAGEFAEELVHSAASVPQALYEMTEGWEDRVLFNA